MCVDWRKFHCSTTRRCSTNVMDCAWLSAEQRRPRDTDALSVLLQDQRLLRTEWHRDMIFWKTKQHSDTAKEWSTTSHVWISTTCQRSECWQSERPINIECLIRIVGTTDVGSVSFRHSAIVYLDDIFCTLSWILCYNVVRDV